MQRKKWYAIQTYAGSELRVKRQLEERVGQLGLERYFTPIPSDGGQELFFVPVEEVITSRSRRGRATEYRVPYEYDLMVKTNERIQRGDLIARRPPRHLEKAANVQAVESLWCVVVELANRSEVEYLIPQERGLRRDVRVGERVRPGMPLTRDLSDRYMVEVRGQIVVRDRVRRVSLRYEDGNEEVRIVPEAYVPPRLKEGARLRAGAEIEREHKLYSRATGLLKVKEYKEKRLVTVQRIERRRLIPGYVFTKMGLDEDQMRQLIEGLDGVIRYVGSRFHALPIEGKEMQFIQRKAGMAEIPVSETKRPKVEVEFEVGEVVQIVEGPFADFTGEIKEIDKDAEEVVVTVKIFGRETPVRISFDGIDKV